MHTRSTTISMVFLGFLVSACGIGQPKVSTIEVTRIAPQTQIVTSEVIKIIPATRIVTSEVTRVITVTQIVTSEVTRVVQATALPTPAAQPSDRTVGVFPGIPLLVSRAQHSTTRLSDGRIIVIGGSREQEEFLAEVEIIDPANNLITQAASLNTPRHDHSATFLFDGRVLVVGGYNRSQGQLEDAEIYDPTTNVWTGVPPLYSHGVQHTATRMEDGRVLVVGGCIASGVCTGRAEIFDPQTNSWIEAASLESDRASHSAHLLDSGLVLVAGGGSASGKPAGGDALLYDPELNVWIPTGPMINPRVQAASVKLPDGRVLVAGGMTLEGAQVQKISASGEIYSPETNTWTEVASLSQPRYTFILALSPVGQILAIGGSRDYANYWSDSSFIKEIESYDLQENLWRVVGWLQQPESYAASEFFPDGSLWLTGGRTNTSFWSDTWLIRPN